MIHSFGVREGRITLNRMVELLATNPARAVRPLPAQGDDRGRLRRGHRRLRPREEGHDLRGDTEVALGLQPLRGDRDHRLSGDGARAGHDRRRRRRAEGRAGVRPVRRPGALRRRAQAGRGHHGLTRLAGRTGPCPRDSPWDPSIWCSQGSRWLETVVRRPFGQVQGLSPDRSGWTWSKEPRGKAPRGGRGRRARGRARSRASGRPR